MSTNTNLNVMTVKLSEAAAIIKTAAIAGQSVMLWGSPGIGKSDLIRAIAGSAYHIEDLRLSQMESVDIRGLPHNLEEDGDVTTIWAMPTFIRRARREFDKTGKFTIYFFDEITSANSSLQSAAYQLILDRKIGDYAMNPGDIVVAAGNRMTDRGATFNMLSPLANRFLHLEIRVDFDDWQEWAIETKLNPDVVGYLSAFKDHLNKFDPKTTDRAFPTPRSWAAVGRMVDAGTPESLMLEMVSGLVGAGVARQFITHRKYSANLPPVNQIFDGTAKALGKVEISAAYALGTSVTYEFIERFKQYKAAKTEGGKKAELAEKKWLAEFDNAMAYIQANLSKELVITVATSSTQNKGAPVIFPLAKTPAGRAFFENYGKLLFKVLNTND